MLIQCGPSVCKPVHVKLTLELLRTGKINYQLRHQVFDFGISDPGGVVSFPLLFQRERGDGSGPQPLATLNGHRQPGDVAVVSGVKMNHF